MSSSRYGYPFVVAATQSVLGLVLAGCGESPGDPEQPRSASDPAQAMAETRSVGEAWFESVESEAGVEFTHVQGEQIRHWFPEIMGGGGAFLDFDGDGFLDIYLVQGGDLAGAGSAANQLFRNRGDGTFEDVTASSGTGDRGYGMGVACADYDGDGRVDIHVTNFGPNALYANRGGGRFEEVAAAAGVDHPGWGTSSAFFDYDADGDLDLLVVNYLHWSIARELQCVSGGGDRDYCSPNAYDRPAADVLYRNAGDGTFVDVTEAAGLQESFGNGLGVAIADFDGDGRQDAYVANDGTPNQLWLNKGGGRFEDGALFSGCAVNRQGTPEAGMGVAAVDFASDGYPDLFMTHLRDETNTLYRNVKGRFEDVTASAGLSAPTIRYTGFGMGFADFDTDGVLDLYIANGRVGRWSPAPSPTDPYAEPNLLFRGARSGPVDIAFSEVLPVGGTAEVQIETSRAAAFGDYDNDGAVDVLVVNCGGPARLLRNRVGRGGSWIGFRVLEDGSDALGARVRLRAGDALQTRTVQVVHSYCASSDARVHFGLGEAAQADEVTVEWPDGRVSSFGALAAGSYHELEGESSR